MHQDLQYIRFRTGNETVLINVEHICAIVCSEETCRILTVDGSKFSIQHDTWEALLNAHLNDRIIWSG
jgi:hypothetical protein